MSSSSSDSEANRFPANANVAANPVSPPSDQAFAVTQPLREIAADDPASLLVRVLDQYLADLRAGRPVNRERLLAEHPDLAAQLNECLAGIEFIHRAAPANSTTPTQLGDFRIVREVGRGGMGVVYEAEQISLNRRVALKVLRFGAASDTEAMQRFQREAETVAGLHHTNIVPIFAIGCEQGVNYYAMQFIEGRSLNDCGLRIANFGWRIEGRSRCFQIRNPHSAIPNSTRQLRSASGRSTCPRASARRDSSRHQAVKSDS